LEKRTTTKIEDILFDHITHKESLGIAAQKIINEYNENNNVTPFIQLYGLIEFKMLMI